MTEAPRSTSISRRRFPQGSGLAATVGLAGCLGRSGGSGLDELSVAYMPIYPDVQCFVMEEEGLFDQLSVPVSGKKFSNGPSIVQASTTGDFNVMMFGIVPAMTIMDKDTPVKMTAANIKNAMQILTTDKSTTLWEEHGSDAFAEFEAEKGRKFTFDTFPPGSVPDTLLRYWIQNTLGLDPEEDVNIKGPDGVTAVQQALLLNNVGGTSIMEPVPTVIDANDAPFQPIAWAGDFMPGQPAAVTLMHDRLRQDNHDPVTEFVELHRQATNFVVDNPDTAAQHASTVVGESALPVETARAALDSPASDFITDPYGIEGGAEIFADYARTLGKTETQLTVDEMLDCGIYDSL